MKPYLVLRKNNKTVEKCSLTIFYFRIISPETTESASTAHIEVSIHNSVFSVVIKTTSTCSLHVEERQRLELAEPLPPNETLDCRGWNDWH